ncbi:MAG: alpha-L-fucosidase [Clostridia bacterium]|nr:alpha-L-fucosidase [Clostridia bacterium]
MFDATFESLYEHSYPDWFRDAKFGIWSHWGPQSVPMCGDWYARNMYVQGSPQYLYHLRHYGHPSVFGYKDICALWKAERFDPEGLMEKYVKAGAKYFVAQAVHHDHFFNYDSALNPMNSVRVGPHKDIVGLWQAAARKHGLPFGVTEHLGASFSWWRVNKGCDASGPFKGVPYDGNDPAWRHFYHDNDEYAGKEINDWPFQPWYTANPAFHDYWKRCMFELIDRYKPDLLYSDGALPFCDQWQADEAYVLNERYREGLEVVAHLYNTSAGLYGENRAVYTQKSRFEGVYRVGVLDVERGLLDKASACPWQTDTCIGGWFYDAKAAYKTPREIIDILIDVASKNGCLLLNILQKPDGTIDDEAEFILDELAGWMQTHGEGIHGTRPWKTASEGTSFLDFRDFREDAVTWNSSDVRYVCKGSTVYAFLMGAVPGRSAVLHSFSQGEKVRSVRLLGAGEAPFVHQFGVLTVPLPERLPTAYVPCLAIELEAEEEQP